MRTHFTPMRELPETHHFGQNDVLVVFGELFQRGYANGIVDEAQRAGMKIIYSTVGRRDDKNQLRPLTDGEIEEKSVKSSTLINIPLEAGFDLQPSSSGKCPVDQLQGIKLSEWNQVKMDFQEIEQSRALGVKSFKDRLKMYFAELENHIPPDANVLFVHTMAGGVPRAKIVMPAMNRVFKGAGDRFASSEEFWTTDLGRFCAASFEEVTANTLRHLLELSTPIREKVQRSGKRVSYVAYGYHGTDVLVDENYQWQSYSPYLQGFAKIQLENIASEYFEQGVSVSVFNAPEILTNSSSIFLGVEVSLYPLVGALEKEGGQCLEIQEILKVCEQKLKEPYRLEDILKYSSNYMRSDITRQWSDFSQWPQHNGLEQMNQMREASTELINMHQDIKDLMTATLSEVVFRSCGEIMLAEAWLPRKPVWWLGHDIVAKQRATH